MVTEEDIQRAVNQIVAKFSPQKVILFGARAEGRSRPHSPVNLLVILPFEGNAFHKSVEISSAVDGPFTAFVHAYTPEQAAENYRYCDPLVGYALDSGKALYEPPLEHDIVRESQAAWRHKIRIPQAPSITPQDIQGVVDQIVARFDPEKVILFGSRAEGYERPWSDVDLLVILPFDDHPARKAAEIACAIDYHFPLDLLARTPEDTLARYRQCDPLIRDAIDRGKVLYQRAA